MRYAALLMQDGHRDRPHEDLRYRFELQEDVPWKSVAVALFLLAFGSLFLVISHFIYTRHMGGDSSQAYGFLVLGVLLFLPGKQNDTALPPVHFVLTVGPCLSPNHPAIPKLAPVASALLEISECEIGNKQCRAL